jgi:ABC-type lipoprotein release transport system permease subunit
MALGAETAQLSWLILRRVLVQLSIGLMFGLAGALAVGRLLHSVLFETSQGDPMTLILISMILIVVTAGASLWPTWQAAHLDPATTLRHE